MPCTSSGKAGTTLLRSYPARAPGVAFRVVDGEALIVDGRLGKIYSLNPVGSVLWGMVDGRTSMQEMVSALSAQFDVDRQQAYEDLAVFVGELEAKGLLESIERTEGSS